MSISIGVSVEVENYDLSKEEALKAAILDVFYAFEAANLKTWKPEGYNQLYIYAEGSQGGLGIEGEEFALPAVRALHAVDPTAEVTVDVSWLEETPHNTYTVDDLDYEGPPGHGTTEELPHYDAD